MTETNAAGISGKTFKAKALPVVDTRDPFGQVLRWLSAQCLIEPLPAEWLDILKRIDRMSPGAKF